MSAVTEALQEVEDWLRRRRDEDMPNVGAEDRTLRHISQGRAAALSEATAYVAFLRSRRNVAQQ